MLKNVLSNLLTGVLTLSALVVTGSVVHREFFGGPKGAESMQRSIPRADVEALADSGALVGPSGAPVRLAIFSDFQCPYCRQLHYSLRELVRRYPGQLAFSFHHFPSPAHPLAMPAAIAAQCAAAQNRFSEYADRIFELQDSLTPVIWEDLSHRAGVADSAAFRKCRNGSVARLLVEKDVAAGRRLGVAATPVILVGDRMVTGAPPRDSLEAWLERSSKAFAALTRGKR